MLIGVVDPYTHQSAWILETVERIFHHYRDAGVRVAWLSTASVEGTSKFLGPFGENYLSFADPDYEAVKALGIDELPALALVKQDGSIGSLSEGWDPAGWREVAESVVDVTDWSLISIPGPDDPGAYAGTPVS